MRKKNGSGSQPSSVRHLCVGDIRTRIDNNVPGELRKGEGTRLTLRDSIAQLLGVVGIVTPNCDDLRSALWSARRDELCTPFDLF